MVEGPARAQPPGPWSPTERFEGRQPHGLHRRASRKGLVRRPPPPADGMAPDNKCRRPG